MKRKRIVYRKRLLQEGTGFLGVSFCGSLLFGGVYADLGFFDNSLRTAQN